MSINSQGILLGIDAITPSLTILNPINVVRMSNGIFTYLDVERGYIENLPSSIPEDWGINTIMNCTFNTLNAGNIEFIADRIDKILVKRRRVDPPYTEATWTTLFEIEVEDESNLNFVVNDIANVYGATYVYQLVPVGIQEQGGVEVEVEGMGQDSEQVISKFDGVFICDSISAVKLFSGVQYGSMQTTQLTGVHQTLGGKYPIVVTNSDVNYHSGSITGTILNEDYGAKIYKTNEYGEEVWTGRYYGMDRLKIVEARKKLDDFLTNKKDNHK